MANWSWGWWDIRDHTLQQSITLQYPNDSASKTTTFRLYQKRPTDASFSLVAEFTGIDSTNCSGTGGGQGKIVGEWALMGSPWSSCPYWSLARVKPGTTYAGSTGAGSFPVSSYAIWEYNFYITAVNSSGVEGQPSLTAKQGLLDSTTIISPTSSQSPTSKTPIFHLSYFNYKWDISSKNPYFCSDECRGKFQENKNIEKEMQKKGMTKEIKC